ncbi:ribosome small subunit-dependent GTPase A [Pediococcus siamensis]|uniref:ribosome small subunit-dependent GTPase A n=1 Tax=Pediococcus siamensis TaxID=381829 RepID=UPI00399F4A25
MKHKQLKTFGFNEEIQDYVTHHLQGLALGRVISQQRNLYEVMLEDKQIRAVVSGRIQNLALDAQDFPAVGDWVGMRQTGLSTDTAIIERIVPRQSVFLRKMAGRQSAVQVVAANVDTIFICMALDGNYNLKRLERYLTVAFASGAKPVIILTKADLATDLDQQLASVTKIASGAQVVSCSSADDSWLRVKKFVAPGETVAFIGSSGVGKTTLINQLMGKKIGATQAVRSSDSHGRHTTTSRELMQLPDGGLVIDTPGMRELGVVSGDFATTFADITELAQSCKFRDCRHENEPGCAVQEAIRTGTLSPERLASYRKLQAEASTNENLRGRARENAKVDRMFGGKKQMKAFLKAQRKRRR